MSHLAIVYGPQGCGKTSKSSELAAYFNVKFIADNATIEQIRIAHPSESVLYLTNDPLALEHGAVHFDSVISNIDLCAS